MTKDQFIQWAVGKGWELDKYGHLQRQHESRGVMETYRYKLNAYSVRREVRSSIGGKNEWVRLKSAYYKNLSVTLEGKISGFRIRGA